MSKKKPFINRKTLWLFIAAFIFASGIFITWLQKREKPIEVTTEKAFRKEVVHVITATGKIEPELVVAMSPDVSGEIIELPVKDGQSVQKGDLLFKIQPDLYINQVQQSEAQLNSAKAQSEEAKARMVKADNDFRKAKVLYKEKLIAESDYIAAKSNADAALAAYRASQFSVAQSKSMLSQNRDRMQKTVVRAPINGSIIALNSKLGERVVGTGQFPGTEVLKLANLDNMQVEVEINENDIVKVKQGNSVIIAVDALPNQTFKGTVREISNSAIAKAAGTQEEVTNFSVKISILNHARLLKPGMSATADIETERVHNALVVPIQSVTMRGSAPQAKAQKPDDHAVTISTPIKAVDDKQGVFVVMNNKAWFRPVKTATTDNTHIIVTEGIREGEEVVSGSYNAISSQLQNGCTIKRAKQP